VNKDYQYQLYLRRRRYQLLKISGITATTRASHIRLQTETIGRHASVISRRQVLVTNNTNFQPFPVFRWPLLRRRDGDDIILISCKLPLPPPSNLWDRSAAFCCNAH